MSVKIFRVTFGDEAGGERTVKVPSKTEVQAADAAVGLARSGEFVVRIMETDDPYQEVDAGLPGTQTHPDQPT